MRRCCNFISLGTLFGMPPKKKTQKKDEDSDESFDAGIKRKTAT